MPLHDWNRVDAGVFHDFHQGWTIAIRNALNLGVLPEGYFALAEPGGPIPDVITLHGSDEAPERSGGGIEVAESPPRTRFQSSAEADVYAAKANRIAIHHRLGEVVAIIEIVSPGNKSSRHALRAFVEKARQTLDQGIHLLVVDLFPPGPRDPQGIHKAIWDEFIDEPFDLPPDKPLTLAAYVGGTLKRSYVEPCAVGDSLPDMPIFLSPDRYVLAPLDGTYASTWAACPKQVKALIEERE